jgi:hypothetical protein
VLCTSILVPAAPLFQPRSGIGALASNEGTGQEEKKDAESG